MPIRFLRPQTLSALWSSVLLASVLLALATPLWAQKDAGAIVGLVRDPSGAVVTGAKVTVEDVDRGIQLTLSTNNKGEYVASPLRIGRYSVTVEKEGFKKAVAGPVQVNIQDRVGVNLKLEPGMATEIVTVTGQRPQLETETSELGQVVDSRRINGLQRQLHLRRRDLRFASGTTKLRGKSQRHVRCPHRSLGWAANQYLPQRHHRSTSGASCGPVSGAQCPSVRPQSFPFRSKAQQNG